MPSSSAGAVAPILLLIQSFFYQKTVEVRPDVPGAPFFTLALERMGARAAEPGVRWQISIGVYLSIGGLFTPKLSTPPRRQRLRSRSRAIGGPTRVGEVCCKAFCGSRLELASSRV